MNGRVLFTALMFAVVHVAEAQPTEKPRAVGILSLSGGPTLHDEVFERRLRELGWAAGQNVRFEYRRAANSVDRVSALAEDLVRLNVDVIVAQSTPVVQAAKHATQTIRGTTRRGTCSSSARSSSARSVREMRSRFDFVLACKD